MASTLVHLAVAALLAAALLGDAFDVRSLLVVLVATALVDLDAFVGLAVEGAHRAALHTYLLPAAAAVLVYADLRREDSLLRRWRPDAGRVAWVAILAVATAGIGLDMVTNGVNAFYPVHDQFYTVDGEFLLSDQRGVVQSFVDLSPPEPSDPATPRTTNNTHFSTGVDPSKGASETAVERVFPLVRSGRDLLLVVLGFGVAAARVWEEGDRSLPGRRAN